MTAQVTHFAIYSKEPQKLARFYKELFGWRVVRAIGTDYFHIHLEPAGTELRGGVMPRPLDGPRSWVSYVLVESVDDTLHRVRQLGGQIVRGTTVSGQAWSAVLQDPEGNMFVVYEVTSSVPDRADAAAAVSHAG